jgi:hypothetical protein
MQIPEILHGNRSSKKRQKFFFWYDVNNNLTAARNLHLTCSMMAKSSNEPLELGEEIYWKRICKFCKKFGLCVNKYKRGKVRNFELPACLMK